MHPSRADLIKYLTADPGDRQKLGDTAAHLEQCAVCRAALARIEAWNQATAESTAQGLPAEAGLLADRLCLEAVSVSRIIELTPMAIEPAAEQVRLAADGQREAPLKKGLEQIATLFSEDPEVVLRIMRDRETGEKSLHLIGTDPQQTTNVMIQIVEPSMDFVTDGLGVAYLGERQLDNPADLKWQIRLPDATFMLKPLEYDPEKPGAKQQFDLEADKDNRVRVELEGRAEGIMLRLTLLRIGGHEDLESARVVVSQGTAEFQSVTAQPDKACTVTGLTASAPINIRIFAE